MSKFMVIYAQERSFLLKHRVLFFFGHFEFKYQKVVKVNLQTFFAYVSKMLKNLRFKAILQISII